MSSSSREIDVDYSEYLGPNYKQEKLPNHISTLISNHVSWSDIFNIVLHFSPVAFAAKQELYKVPVMGLFTACLGCIFISRGGTEEERNFNIEQIK